jgi:nucleoside-diphosphate-sugar epimerase
VLEVARLVMEATASDSPVEFFPPEDDPGVRRPDIARPRRILDWEPTMTFQDGLAPTVDWFRGEIRAPEKTRTVRSYSQKQNKGRKLSFCSLPP